MRKKVGRRKKSSEIYKLKEVKNLYLWDLAYSVGEDTVGSWKIYLKWTYKKVSKLSF